MTRLAHSPEAEFRALMSAVHLEGAVDLVYEYGDRGSLHVWILCDAFDGLGYTQRRELVKPALRALHADVRVRINLLFFLSHTEFEDQYGADLRLFEDPHEEEIHNGPFKLSRPATAADAATA